MIEAVNLIKFQIYILFSFSLKLLLFSAKGSSKLFSFGGGFHFSFFI